MRKWFPFAIVLATRGFAQDCGWEQRLPMHNPPALSYAQVMAFDSMRSATVLFSSSLDGLRETLEWGGSDWLVRSVEGPPAQSDSAMVFDSKRGVSVFCGGTTKLGDISDTWEWNGQDWQPRHVGPPDRSSHAMAYDSSRAVTVLFGGSTIEGEDLVLFGDTWEWDGQTWQELANTGPSPRIFHAMAFDAKRRVTVLYGGAGSGEQFDDTWEWDGKTWTQRQVQGPGKRFRGAMVYDQRMEVCILFGGYIGNDATDDTWAWDGQIWTKLNTPDAPNPRADHAMAYDSSRHAVVLFGGTPDGQNFYNDTWEFTCTAPCYPDLNGDGTLDLFDFLAFVNSFNAGEGGAADCDKNGVLDLFDFLCFVNSFNEGC